MTMGHRNEYAQHQRIWQLNLSNLLLKAFGQIDWYDFVFDSTSVSRDEHIEDRYKMHKRMSINYVSVL